VACAAIINVPGDHPTIQGAIDAAVGGDEIVVQAGTYHERINLKGKAIKVRSTDPANPAIVSSTIIDADDLGSCVKCNSGESSATIVDGFTLRDGSGTALGENRFGGGVYVAGGADPTIDRCVIRDCTAFAGGGVYIVNGSPLIARCTIRDNTALDGGGLNIALSSARVRGCRIFANTADYGGGMSTHAGGSEFTNCLFYDNVGGTWGGAGWIECGSICELNDCTIANNTSPVGRALRVDSEAKPVIANSILWLNGGVNQISQASDGVATLLFCDYEGGWSGEGSSNISTNPLFANAGADDYHLNAGSPCLNNGSNALVPPGVTTDLDGNNRFVGIVDRGCFERPAALDEEGNSEHPDLTSFELLVLILQAWGPCMPGAGCPYDLNDDGEVGLDDVVIVLNDWE